MLSKLFGTETVFDIFKNLESPKWGFEDFFEITRLPAVFAILDTLKGPAWGLRKINS
jgi:hypothetical protein